MNMKAWLFTPLFTFAALFGSAYIDGESPDIPIHPSVNAADDAQALAGECGDLTLDNSSNVLDLVSTLGILAGIAPDPVTEKEIQTRMTQERVVDVNLNGATDSGDGDLILDHIVGLKEGLDACGLAIEVGDVQGVAGQQSVTVDVFLHYATQGLSGYQLQASIEDTDIARITGAEAPDIGLTIIDSDDSFAIVTAGDLLNVIRGSDQPVLLLTLELTLVDEGSTSIDLTLTILDSDVATNGSFNLIPATQRFVFPGAVEVSAAP
jgi:hypothetical protein